MLSDNEIIKRVQKGQTDDFAHLVRRYETPAYSTAYRILGRREDAEDAVQVSFLRAYQALDSYNQDGTFWPWMRRIVINCCLNRLPREFPSDSIEQIIESEQPCIDTVEAEAFRRCDAGRIREMITQLPTSYRLVAVLKYQEDLNATEIAEFINETPGAVRVRLHRALKMLSQKLAVTAHEL